MALVHFNMATFSGGQGCHDNTWDQARHPSTFAPTQLDTDQWVESMVALGATEAVLTAKHSCGFCLWPTEAKFPNGSRYTYSVAGPGGIGVDVIQQFTESCKKAGVGHGFYYSVSQNFLLNVDGNKVQNTSLLPGQIKVTAEEYASIALSQVTELWSNYGELTEIWFDGGYEPDIKAALTKLLAEKQPQAVAFNGEGISTNPIRWIGTETGMPSYPVWSTGESGQGDPNSDIWCPAACDTTLQDFDNWFFVRGLSIRTLDTLKDVYHKTVGQNGHLELDFAIDQQGRVNETHAAAYKALGSWIRSCYGDPIATAAANSSTITLGPFAATTVDRFMVREDQRFGQRVREYTIEIMPAGSSTYEVFSKGSSIGNKRIDLGTTSTPTPHKIIAARLSVSQSTATPHIPVFAAFGPSGC